MAEVQIMQKFFSAMKIRKGNRIGIIQLRVENMDNKDIEILLGTIESSPFRRMECQIEIGIKNARRNWKKKAISDEDFKRVVTKMWVPIDDIKGTLLHFSTFEKDYQTDLARAHQTNSELRGYVEKWIALEQKLARMLEAEQQNYDTAKAMPTPNRDIDKGDLLSRSWGRICLIKEIFGISTSEVKP